MEKKFWLQKWDEQQIGFHQSEFHPNLSKNIELIKNTKGAIFIPLCGKTKDIHFFTQLGKKVIGCELSPRACEDFFKEAKLNYTIEKDGEFNKYIGEQVVIFQGDFFKLQKRHLKEATFLYDRAALIALPQELRSNYLSHFKNIFQGNSGIIISLEYNQALVDGPPFSVETMEIKNALNNHNYFKVGKINTEKILANNPKFKKANIEFFTEKTYILNQL